MGRLYQRFTLRNAVLGDKIIKSPGGWNDAEFVSERGKEHDLNVDYVSDLNFHGTSAKGDGGRDYILTVESFQGINAEILLIVATSPDKINWTDRYIGKLDLEELEEKNDKAKFIEIPVTVVDFKTTFRERRKTKVNLNDRVNLDNTNMLNYQANIINNKGRILKQEYDAEYSNDDPTFNTKLAGGTGTGTVFYNFGYQKINVNDIQGFSFTAFSATPQVISLFEAPDDGNYSIVGDFVADLEIDVFATTGNTDIYNSKLWYRIDDDEPVLLKNDQVNTSAQAYTFNDFLGDFNLSLDLKKGQKVFLYGELNANKITSIEAVQFRITVKSGSINVTGLTTFKETTTKTYLIHDIFSIICDSITGKDNSFYSEFLGNVNTQFRNYTENGEFSFYAVSSGYDLREIDRDFSMSFNEAYEWLNAITPLCISFETIDLNQVVRIEPIEYAYNPTTLTTLSTRFINRRKDKNAFFNVIKSGYDVWEAENVNGLNEPNSRREYSTTLRSIGKDYKIRSGFIAASQVMEVTRRKSEEKTTDFQFDKNIFIYALKRTLVNDVPVALNELENNENYASVLNLPEPNTAINLRLSPAMNVLRHGSVINSGLIKYPGTPYKLTEGQGNDKMQTQTNETFRGDFNNQTLSENQDILWSYAEKTESNPLFSGDLIEFQSPLTFAQLVNLKDEVTRDANGVLNKHKAIEVTDGETTKKGWIIDLSYDHSDEPIGKFVLKEINQEIFGITPSVTTKLQFEDGEYILLSDNKLVNL